MESDRTSVSERRPAVESKVDPANSPGTVRSWGRNVLPFVSLLGLLIITYVLGAAVMYFQFPTSDSLSKGFRGGRAWIDEQFGSSSPLVEINPTTAGIVDQPGKTCDGYTLYACASMNALSTRVYLINMQRQVVHQWSASFAKIWPKPPHIPGRLIHDNQVCVFACHLYENGDLLVVFHSLERTVRGYGLAKLDKDSNVLWSYAANVHHDVVVGDDGTIYTLIQRQVNEGHKGLEFVPLPWLVDYLVMLSPDGQEIGEPISILDALWKSPFNALLSPLETAYKPVLASSQMWYAEAHNDVRLQQDLLHANSVCVLTRELASRYPNYKEGQVLISMRRLHALAVLDPPTRSVVWGACGPWHLQHDAQFLDNGHLLMFDNIGSPHGSRVIEYDPLNGSFPWSYPGVDNTPFFSRDRGMAQRLPNGNTLIVDSEGKEMMEVTPGKEVVWNCIAHGFITTARRYIPSQINFLKPGHPPRS